MIKKILIIILSVLIFNACSTIDKQYIFRPTGDTKGILISGSPKDIYDEYSPLKVIEIEDKRNGTHVEHKIKLVDNKIKIVKDGKEYIIPYSKSEDYDDIHIYIRVSKNGVNITDGDFIAHIGKVKLDTGEIVNIPPLHFKKYIYIYKYGMLAGFDPVGKIKTYSGTVEEYKKNGWKEE